MGLLAGIARGGRWGIAGALVIGATGCGKGCHGDHPYVPYTIDSSPGPATAIDAGAALPEQDAGAPAGFAEKGGAVAPPNETEWTLEGAHLTAPPGRVFVLGLVHDFDEDGAPDALAIVRRADGEKAPGELFYYRGRSPQELAPPEAIAPPVELADRPGDPSCAPSQRLGQIGKHSVFVEIGVACATRADTAPTRWIGVATVDKAAKLRFAAEVLDPPSAPKLSLDVNGADADGDGLEDVTLRMTLEGGGAPFEPGPRMSAVVRWLDRPAGLARDTSSFEGSLASLAATALARAGRAKEAPSVPLYVSQIRALYRTLCPEAGAPRVVRRAGPGASSCGQSRALEDAGIAEVRAYITMGDPLRAVTALERAQRAPATRTTARTTEATGFVTQAAPVQTARATRTAAAVPQIERGHGPAWGALAFEGSGKVLVRTAAGVVRVDAEHGDEEAADGVTAWKGAVRAPDASARWIEAYNPCDGVALRATFEVGDDVKDVALPVAPPFGTKCTTSRGEPAHVVPFAWGPRGLEAVVAGEPVLVSPDLARATALVAPLDQPVLLGAPRSPNGKWSVFPTSLGLLVRGEGRAQLYRASDVEGAYAALRDCAISDDATHVACVRSGRVWMGTWDVTGH